MNESISVVIPVYNSEETLSDLLVRLHRVLVTLGRAFEIILVNDGSADRSWDIINSLKRRWPTVVGINLSRNYGQHNALLCGIRRARHEITITMDDDLQHPPEEIPRLLEKVSEGVDVVYGSPAQEQHGWWRDWASISVKWLLSNLVGARTALQVSAFRAFRTRLRDAFTNYSSPFVSIDVLLTWATTSFAAVVVRHEPRRNRASGYTLWRLIAHALNLLTGFSVRPLRLASLLGILVTALGMCALIFAMVRALIAGSTVPGFLFLTSIITLFSGTELFALGILGEYLGRMYLRTMERPPYVIRETTTAVAGMEDRACA